MPTKPTSYNIGDQVKLDPPLTAAHSCIAGHVVYYRGKHNPKKPRIRWRSGFGTTCGASNLIPLAPEERFTVGQPLDCDLP
jgi:hypothetical protein